MCMCVYSIHVTEIMMCTCAVSSAQVIPLMEGGEETEVTEVNKTRYLNILSQYRFTKRVGEEIDHFLKG